MLSKFHKSEKGFTLIELLIVVAIIGILAAIAIPQFAAYRMRGYNAAANSDVRNAGTAEEAMMADFNGYGRSNQGTMLLPAALLGGTGGGVVIAGPLAGATPTVVGGSLSMGPSAGPPVRPIVGVGVGASANVSMIADTLNGAGPLAGYGSSFITIGKHTQGDRAFARETESTATFQCQNSGVAWVNVAGVAMILNPGASAAVDLGDGAVNAVACGGAEIVNWLPM